MYQNIDLLEELMHFSRLPSRNGGPTSERREWRGLFIIIILYYAIYRQHTNHTNTNS